MEEFQTPAKGVCAWGKTGGGIQYFQPEGSTFMESTRGKGAFAECRYSNGQQPCRAHPGEPVS